MLLPVADDRACCKIDRRAWTDRARTRDVAARTTKARKQPPHNKTGLTQDGVSSTSTRRSYRRRFEKFRWKPPAREAERRLPNCSATQHSIIPAPSACSTAQLVLRHVPTCRSNRWEQIGLPVVFDRSIHRSSQLTESSSHPIPRAQASHHPAQAVAASKAWRVPRSDCKGR